VSLIVPVVLALALTACSSSGSGVGSTTTRSDRPTTTVGAGATASTTPTDAETAGPLGDLLGRLSDTERTCLTRESGGSIDMADAAGFEKVFAALVACRPAAMIQDMADSAQAQANIEPKQATCATNAMLDLLARNRTLITRMAAGADLGDDVRAQLRTPLQTCGLSATQIESLTA
jgi:hypothetical protein